MTDKGYIQDVSQPTTGKGTLIDHVYIKTTQYDTQTIVLPGSTPCSALLIVVGLT